jgi:23S rRNA (uracil1939-C5)-methyltransferase
VEARDSGGQFADQSAQFEWKRAIVAGQLQHLGGLVAPSVAATVAPGPPYGYRNRMDFSVSEGGLALSRARSHELEPTETCLIAAPEIQEIMARLGPLDRIRKLVIRVGLGTGERLIAIEGRVPADAGAWDASVIRFGRGRPTAVIAGVDHIHEMVAGTRFRITGTAFFQTNTAGAGELVRLVRAGLEPGPEDTLVDAYAGGGLFAATVGAEAGRVIAVELGRAAASDLTHNLAIAGAAAEVRRGRAENVLAELREPWDLAVCDPPRKGLGPDGVTAITAGIPRRLAYVSCDPAALARDGRLLADAGYRLSLATPVDLFPQTYHIETVAIFERN